MKRFLSAGILLTIICTIFSCTSREVEVKVTGITLNSEALELTEGDSFKLTATVIPEIATDKTIIWSSSNASIADVENGMVTAVKAGVATITAASRDGGAEASCTVTVSGKGIPVESVTLDIKSVELVIGETITLTATVKPDNATDSEVKWTTNNAAVATVENGVVTARKAGAASITATAGGMNATCTVTVSDAYIEVASVTLDKTSLSLTEGETATLTATVKPANATDKVVKWSSSDTDILTVFGGKVTAVAAGVATVTAEAGGKSATCEIQVNKKIEVESVTLDEEKITIAIGETVTLTATVKPDDAYDKTVTWSTSDTEVAAIKNGTVTGLAEGTAVITATAGEQAASCIVKVEKVELESISLNYTEMTLNPGETEILEVSFNPGNATDKSVLWKTSDYNIVRVDDNGKITAVAMGTAEITAIAGNCRATCTVKVNNNDYLTLTNTSRNEGTVTIRANGNFVPVISIKYSTDKGRSWTELTGFNNTRTITLPAGGSVRLWAENATYSHQDPSKKYNWWSISADVPYNLSGDLMTISSDEDRIQSAYAFYKLFSSDKNLKSAAQLKLSAATLSEHCYESMFEGCTSLEKAPALPASALASSCYKSMFQDCTALPEMPELPATTMATYCYDGIFQGCTSLSTVHELNADVLAQYCYRSMFQGCTALRKAPELPAATLKEMCYASMFQGCTSLTEAPALPAEKMAMGCYFNMFMGCKSLKTAPELPSTSLANYCYFAMFSDCPSLTEAPALPATKLAGYCYSQMFNSCILLETAPVLPAEKLVRYCYAGMFIACKALNDITCLATDISAEGCTKEWVNGVADKGTFTVKDGMESWETGTSGIPEGWDTITWEDPETSTNK